ncbi:Hsp20/alpha crystallin family protein [Clostridium paraputrificum]|uniref:Hsp20/alpha crystallin family protein n=1 Tax=Clostridium TaxID=1485 RepID=UPI003D340D31
MFGMFPFNFNNNNNNNPNNYNNGNNINIFDTLLNDNFINGMVDQLLSSDLVNDLVSEMTQEDNYDVELKDYGDYYLIKGYLPGLTPKDVSIDFEKNKAILTIKKKQSYSNGRNAMVTVIQTGGNLVKNFYISEVDVTKLKASFDNSLLLLTLPKVKKIEDEVISTTADNPIIIDVDNYKIE